MTPLDPETWERLVDLFTAARTVSESEREAWILERTAGEPRLASELASMLRASGSDAALSLERELAPRASPGPLASGTLIGGLYRLLREIGRGGMGEVYLAERVDGTYEHHVAIKVLRAGVHGRDAIARFGQERRILARLTHPAVAPLLDGGVLEDGRPYFVLQYVEGAPVTEGADAARMSVRERLALLIPICRAVEFAHTRLIVHRDIKPSNILLTREGDVRLLDFGIAKLLSNDDAGIDAGLTRFGLVPMTPERASPEQVRGDPVTPATDVWALGVLMHELLTGRLPSDAKAMSESPLAEAAAARATTPARLRRAIRGDLDVIVARATHPDPERRYQRAAQLADDIEAHLDRRPIAARPDAWRYRARRFVARHRTASVLTAASVLMLTMVGIGTARQNAVTRAERDRAETETRHAKATADLLVGLLRASGPREGASMEQISVAELLARGDAQVASTLGAQPEIQARLWHTLATIHVDRSELSTALPLYQRAVEASRGRPDIDPDRASLLLDYANLLYLMDRGTDVRAVLVPLVRAAELQQPAQAAVLARALQTLGTAAGGDEGVALVERAVSIWRAAAPADPGLAGSLGALGGLELRHRRDPGRARAHFEEAHAILLRARGDDDLDTLQALNNLATTLPPPQAITTYQTLIAGYKVRLGPDAKALAFAFNNLGVALVQARRYAEGETALREAQARWQRQFGPVHEQTINNLRNIARAQEIDGRFADAWATWGEMARRLEGTPGGAGQLIQFGPQRAQVLRRLGRLREARTLLEQVRASVTPAPSAVLGDVLHGLGLVALDQGRGEEAATRLREAAAMRADVLAAGHPAVEESRAALGRVLIGLGRIDDGRAFVDKALPAFEAWPLAHPDDVAAARLALIAASPAGR